MKSQLDKSRSSNRREKSSQALRTAPAQSRLYLQVLEQRVLLDAAAAQTAQEVAQSSSAPPPEADAPDQHADLVEALAAVQQEPAAPAAAATEPARTEVYFIDRSVDDADALVQSLPADAEVYFIEPQADGVEFIAQTLQGRSDISAIHILSHGEAAALQLGSASLTADSMQGDYRDELAAIGRSLGAEGDILIYGCDFGQGAAGAEAAQVLSNLTAADVAASTDSTGTASLGGDWVLEREVGAVETASVSAEQWDRLMTAPVLDTTPNLAYTAMEDTGAPAAGTAVGVLVSEYTVGMTDTDPGAVKGIAITGVTTTNGVWWYSTDGGATWTEVGTVSNASALLLADNGQTRVYYQANANFNGSAGNAMTLRAWDQSAGTAGTKASVTTLSGAVSTAADTVSVTVSAVNDAPVLAAGTRNLTAISEDLNASTSAPAPTGAVGTPIPNFIGSITDSDTGSVRGIAIVGTDAANGAWWYSVDNGTTWQAVGTASDANAVLMANLNTSRVYFQPNGDFNGTATSEDVPVVISINANDTFENAGHAVTAIDGSPIGAGRSVAVANGTVTLNADGTLSFAPATNFNGATSFTYTVTSGGVTETATVIVNVTAQNDRPTPTNPPGGNPNGQTFDPASGNYAATTIEDTAFSGQVSATDADGDSLSYSVGTGPANGTVTVDAVTGAYTYTPGADFNGSDSFVISISDGTTTVQTTVTMTVTAVADIADDAVTTSEDVPVVISINANDTFENAGHAVTAIDGSSIGVGRSVAVANGTVTLNADGTLSFAPAANFNGATSFTYTVTSGGVTETATATVNVTAVNDWPIPVDPGAPEGGQPPGDPVEPGAPGEAAGQTFDPDSGDYRVTTPQDVPFNGRVAGTDPDGDPLTYTVGSIPSNGTVVLDPEGTYRYTPNAGYVGSDTFVVSISDGKGGVVTSTVFITVTPLNQGARDDFPFIFYPGDDESSQDDGRARWQGAHIEVEPTVIQAVNGARSLIGTRALTEVSGVVLQAVNSVESLDGTAALPMDGAVLQAVNAIDSLNGSASYDRLESPVERAVLLADRAGSTHMDFVSTLRTSDGLTLDLSGDRQQLWVSVNGGADVREVRATLADGRPLPNWARMDSSGFLTIDRPADAEQLRLRVTVVPERGAARSQLIEIDFNSGQMRAVGGSDAPGKHRAPGGSRAAAVAPDFATQLDMAVRGRSDVDMELLELLS